MGAGRLEGGRGKGWMERGRGRGGEGGMWVFGLRSRVGGGSVLLGIWSNTDKMGCSRIDVSFETVLVLLFLWQSYTDPCVRVLE